MNENANAINADNPRAVAGQNKGPVEYGGYGVYRMVVNTDKDEKCLVWVLGGEKGVVTFSVLDTSYVPSRHFPGQLTDGTRTFKSDCIATHSPVHFMNEVSGPHTGCIYLEGVRCYGDAGYMAAGDLFDKFILEWDEDVIWEELKGWYENMTVPPGTSSIRS